ncbi:MAG: aminotransferase, partial [Synechocystis sp.]
MTLVPPTEWSLDSSVRYLNHGSFGAVPRVVSDVQAAIRAEMELNPNQFFRSRLPGLLREARARCAVELGTTEDRLAFVPN